MKFKHVTIREVQIICEHNYPGCMRKESFTPSHGAPVGDAEEEARIKGWKIRQGKTCCPKCVDSLIPIDFNDQYALTRTKK